MHVLYDEEEGPLRQAPLEEEPARQRDLALDLLGLQVLLERLLGLGR